MKKNLVYSILILIVIAVCVFGYMAVHRAGPPRNTQSDDTTQPTLNAPLTAAADVAVTNIINPKPMMSQQTQNETATLHTSMGDITIAFSPELAPNTVANFIKLAQSGFYDGVKFHRVIKGFMIQGGDPLSKDDSKIALWGTGGPGYTFKDEITPASKNVAGTIAMANSGPNTNGSQFFINAVNNDLLDGGYTVFGAVTQGMDVVTAIDNVPTDSKDRPVTPVVIKSITLQ